MRPVRACIAALIALFHAGCGGHGISDSDHFAAELLDSLHAAAPELRVERVGPMRYTISRAGDSSFTVFLDNAYAVYRQDTAARAEIIGRYVAQFIRSSRYRSDTPVDSMRIVPVVKDQHWKQDMHQVMVKSGTRVWEFATEDLNSALVIVYAEDDSASISMLSSEKLNAAGVAAARLRPLACANLKRILPPLEYSEADGLYSVHADGNYESSLLLLDSLWTRDNFKVRGQFVVAIPARGELYVTGSDDARNLKRMREHVAEVVANAPYPMSETLFVRRNGAWQVFTQ